MSAQTVEPVWRVLLGYVRPFRGALVVGAVLSLLTGASGLALPLVVRELITGLRSDRRHVFSAGAGHAAARIF